MTKSQMMRHSNLMEVTFPGRERENLRHHQSHTQLSRIFFLHPEGNLLKDITNKKGNPKFKYYYSSTKSILESMEQVLELSKSWEESPKDEL